MTIKPKAARALVGVRTKLRDLAAASHAVATARSHEMSSEVAAEADRLEASYDSSRDILAAARSVMDLERGGDAIAYARAELDDARQRASEAEAYAAQTHEALRAKTRQLKSAERIVELVETNLFEREARGEQRIGDDLAGRRR